MYSLVGIDDNAFVVMGYTSKAMRECGYSENDIKQYQKLCMSSNYDDLIVRSMEWIDKCNEIKGEE